MPVKGHLWSTVWRLTFDMTALLDSIHYITRSGHCWTRIGLPERSLLTTDMTMPLGSLTEWLGKGCVPCRPIMPNDTEWCGTWPIPAGSVSVSGNSSGSSSLLLFSLVCCLMNNSVVTSKPFLFLLLTIKRVLNWLYTYFVSEVKSTSIPYVL